MKYISTYTVIDIETPNSNNDSICSIAIINVVDNNVIFQNEFLVNPEDKFDEFNMKLHGINKSTVESAKTFDKVWEDISIYFTNGIIVGHNVTFDLNVICKTLFRYEKSIPEFYYIDTCSLVKGLYKGISNYKLNTVCSYLDIDLINHHNAECDTKACYEIFKRVQSDYGISDDEINKYSFDNLYAKKATKTIIEKSINSFYGIIKGITADKVLNDLEIEAIKKWLKENSKYRFSEPYIKIISSVEKILEDDIITNEEKLNLLKISKQYTSSNSFNDITLSLQVLMGLLEGISCDKKLNTIEIMELKKWMQENEKLKGNYPFDIIFENIDKALDDNFIAGNESEKLLKLFDGFLNPLEDSSNKNTNSEKIMFNNNYICLTGNFEHGSKSEITNKIEKLGGKVVGGVIATLNYLIVGGEGSKDWSFGNYGTKVKRAMELNSKGKNIKIISEVELFENI
jgi:DNA polymerase-3 subunit epsilon